VTQDPTDSLAAIHQCIRAGRREEAEQRCLVLLDAGKAGIDVLLLLGGLQIDRGALALAVATLQRAVELEPGNGDVLLRLAVAQFRKGEIAAARSTLEGLVAGHPADAVAAFHLGLLCEQAGDAADAERHYRAALAIKPAYGDALAQLGLLLLRLTRSADALPLLTRAWNPARPRGDLAAAIARAHLDLGAFASAIEFAGIGTSLVPGAHPAWVVLGTALRRTGQALRAQEALERALQLAPDNALALAELGCNEIDLGRYASGRERLERARAIAPDWSVLRWLDALALPVLPRDAEEVEQALDRFRGGIDALIADLDSGVPQVVDDAQVGLERAQPFLLHYLPADTTALSLRYGQLVESAMRRVAGDDLSAPPGWRALAHGGKLRVGFVSCELRLHTVTRYFGEWLMRLDRERFEVHAWHLDEIADAVTRRIAAQVHVLHHEPRMPVLELAAAIREAQLDVLVYLDVGMDSRPQMLAALRLAPVQCAAYGHPATTGLGNVDWFLSGDAMEPANAAQHYRERLERLPGIGVVPDRPPAPATGEWLPREAGRPMLLCLQSLFKLTPDFDQAIARIARATDARILFFEFPLHCAGRFIERAGQAFRAQGLDIGRHVTVLGRREYADYLGGIASADMVLDSIGFSGGATTIDALSVGTPVVTLEGAFMRGRQTSAMLRLLGADELVASDINTYVELAIALCGDRNRRDALRARLLENVGRLFESGAVMPALEAFLQRVARDAAL
jgi:protein O-GlcNAc transferase